MEVGIALLWDKGTPLKQYLTDRGFDCEIVTPKIFASPLFSAKTCKLAIVPAGFGHAFYSKVLKDLRANSGYITKFVKDGGTLFVSGAFSGRDAYDWLPRGIEYVKEMRLVKTELIKEHKAATIAEKDECMCDGYFEALDNGWDVILAVKEDKEEKAILVVSEYGTGKIIATTIHEYPSEQFIAYCVNR